MRDSRTILLLLATVLLCSCGMRYYMPNQHNVPLLRERGEVRLSVAKAAEGMVHGPENLPRAILGTLLNRVPLREVQVAYGISKHVGLMANATWFKHETSRAQQYGRVLEIAPGCFHAFGKHGVVEGYAGLGLLRSSHHYTYGSHADARFIRPFIQPIVGYASRNFDTALSTRAVWLRCNNRTLTGTEAELALDDQIPVGDARTLIEPTIMMRYGTRAFKLQVQLGWSFCLGPEFRRVDKTFGAGFQFNINNSFPRKS